MSRNFFVGPSGCGKTTLCVSKVHWALQMLKGVKIRIIIISPTAEIQDIYGHLSGYKPEFLPRLDENTGRYLYDSIVKQKKNKIVIGIIDDQGSNTFMKSKLNPLAELVDCARHYHAHLFMCFQQIQQMSTGMRDNYDTLFMFKPDNDKQLKYFREEFCGDLSKETFERLIQQGWDVKDCHKYIQLIRMGGEENNTKQYFLGEEPFEITPLGNKFY